MDQHKAYRMEKRAILKKQSAEEAKTIPQIYDEEAAVSSAEPSTSGQFPFFREVRSAMYEQRAKRFPKLSRDRHDLVLAPEFTRTSVSVDVECVKPYPDFFDDRYIRLLAAMKTWAMV
ncbi:putative myosin-Va [Trichinella spiralis]|uniref:putative myosin-Va n=1 Tax=Trichinella spiralis TaxID=6334 RepID=UPI0001EFC575|nr:putative myosin-Va [Trichinella spiralis]